MSEKRVPTLTDPTGRTHNLAGPTTMIGRAVENEIVVSSQRISREHACIRREGWRVILEDVGSTNGTFLNDQRILEPVQLRDGDHIKVGDVLFVFHDPEVTYQDTVLPELELDIPAGIVRINRQPVDLAPKEFELLAYLFSQPNLVCSKDAIGTAVWPEYQGGVFDYQIENLVRRLRTKLEPDPTNPQLLLTVRGRGYKLVL
ncbi:MAG: winged helix-turn-helix domain-containing protein [Anaerolineae bacterium]|nr:winged helix-turn-helix domain-containing protein [Anaerolineae bacterium]